MGETTDRGVFDFMGKKKEEKCEDVEVADMVEFEPKNPEDNNKHTLTDVLQRSRSHSSSSSDEEIGEGGERKKKKKKGLKEKIKDKISSDHPNEQQQQMDYKDTPFTDPIANYEETGKIEETPLEEKKGFLEKIKEKLPGQHKKPEEGSPTGKAECDERTCSIGGETKEKKGIFEKIKEKLPGGHKNGTHEEEVKEN